MATFTLLTWIAALVMFLWMFSRLFPHIWQNLGNENTTFQFSILIVLWLTIVFGIAGALIRDIYGISVGSFTYWIPILFMGENSGSGIDRTTILFIAGLVALGSTSLIALANNILVRGTKSNYYNYDSAVGFGTIIRFIIEGIGLIASILGILSFYFDYF